MKLTLIFGAIFLLAGCKGTDYNPTVTQGSSYPHTDNFLGQMHCYRAIEAGTGSLWIDTTYQLSLPVISRQGAKISFQLKYIDAIWSATPVPGYQSVWSHIDVDTSKAADGVLECKATGNSDVSAKYCFRFMKDSIFADGDFSAFCGGNEMQFSFKGKQQL